MTTTAVQTAPEVEVQAQPAVKVVTVKEARELAGTGALIHWRPDGKINLADPDSDLCHVKYEGN